MIIKGLKMPEEDHDYLGEFCYEFVRTMALVTLRDMAYSDISGEEMKEQSKGIFRLLNTNAKHYAGDNEQFRGTNYDN